MPYEYVNESTVKFSSDRGNLNIGRPGSVANGSLFHFAGSQPVYKLPAGHKSLTVSGAESVIPKWTKFLRHLPPHSAGIRIGHHEKSSSYRQGAGQLTAASTVQTLIDEEE